MSGIIPASIMTMQYQVDADFKKYVNLSFPHRIKIESIWFTADDGLSGRGYGQTGEPQFWTLERVLRLGGTKMRQTSRNILDTGAFPTDNNLVWLPNWNWYGPGSTTTANDKPSIWFGSQDNDTDVEDSDAETSEMLTHFEDWMGTEQVYRSSARPLPSVEKMSYWFNWDWNTEQKFNENKYKTDLSILNPDEILSLFLYPDGGDWDDYAGDGIATIFIQYTGVSSSPTPKPIQTWGF